MNCQKCQNEVSDKARFCNKCGAEIPEETAIEIILNYYKDGFKSIGNIFKNVFKQKA
jgi:predicted amidophosphoribosyltransferase